MDEAPAVHNASMIWSSNFVSFGSVICDLLWTFAMLLQRCVTCQEVFWDVQSLADLIRENPFNPRKSQIEKCNLSKPDGTRIGRIERIVADQIRVDPFDPCHPCSVPAALQRVEFGGSLW